MVQTGLSNMKFLGRGIAFPFKFSSTGAASTSTNATMSEGVEHVKQALLQLFHTNIGERVIRRDFGTNIGSLVFSPIDEVLTQQILDEVNFAVSKWEKRVIIDKLIVSQLLPASGKVVIDIQFTLISTNVVGNLVFPFYLTDPQKNTQSTEGVLAAQAG